MVFLLVGETENRKPKQKRGIRNAFRLSFYYCYYYYYISVSLSANVSPPPHHIPFGQAHCCVNARRVGHNF